MTIQILTRFPNQVTGAARQTYIFVGASNAVGGIAFDTLRMTVNGEVAFEHGEFRRPDYDGELLLTANYVALRVQPRREFDYSEAVTVETTITNDTIPVSETLTDSFIFTVLDRPPTIVNTAQLAPCQLRFVTPYPDAYLDQFRQILGNGLSPNPRLVTQVAAYRLEASVSRPLVVPLQLTVPTNLVDRDISPMQPLDLALQEKLPLWEPALRSLQGLGVGPGTVDTLRRAMNSGYPHNRIGAAIGATLLAGAFYAAQGV
jgi:hypothetical protein